MVDFVTFMIWKPIKEETKIRHLHACISIT